MDIKIVKTGDCEHTNKFYDESKESMVSYATEEAKKSGKWNKSKELTITLDCFGNDPDEIYVEWEFTK